MLDGLVSILERSKNDATALKNVKQWFSGHPQATTAIIRLSHATVTVAALAAKSALTETLSYLIGEKGFPPNAIYEGKTLLTHACENKHEATACVLAQKLKEIQKSLPYGFTPLHEAAKMGFEGLAKIILGKAPSILDAQSREGATALFLAVQLKHAGLVKLFLEKSADPNIGDAHGLTPVGMASVALHPEILSLLLQHGASPLLENLMQQSRLLLSVARLPENPNKLKCLNLLLASGAGLELSHIPDEILTLYKLQRAQLKDLLILGKQRDQGTVKTRLLTSIEQFEAAIGDPNWQFEEAQLMKTCQHPSFQHLPHVKRMQDCLKAKVTSTQAVIIAPQVIVDEPIIQSQDDIEMMSIEELATHFSAEHILMTNFLKSIDYMVIELSRIDRSFSYDNSRLLNLVTQSLKCFERLSQLSHNKHFRNLKLGKKSVLELGLNDFNHFIMVINSFLQRQLLPTGAQSLAHILDEKLRTTIKQHGRALKESHRGFYNSIVEAQSIVCAKLGRWYLQQGKKDVALSLSLEAMQYCEMLIVDNDSFESSVAYDKAVCLTTIMQVYMDHGWTNKAGSHASVALSLFSQSGIYDNLIPKLVLPLADIFAAKNKLHKTFALLSDAINFLDHAFTMTKEESFEAIDLGKQLSAKLASLKTFHFKERAQNTISSLQGFCQTDIDFKGETIRINIDTTKLHPENQHFLSEFLSKNKCIRVESGNQLHFIPEVVFSKAFSSHISELRNILLMPPSAPKVVDDLVEILEDLALEIREPKMVPVPAVIKEKPEETYGFKKPEGFTKIVPIYSQRLPHNALFITMPEDNDAFTPFYGLVRDEKKTKTFPVHAIAGKGLNQHGVKLGTAVVTQHHKAPEKIAFARLKASSTKRAHGFVEQTIFDEKGKERKLYVIREVVDKKKELRKNYKF